MSHTEETHADLVDLFVGAVNLEQLALKLNGNLGCVGNVERAAGSAMLGSRRVVSAASKL